MSTYGWQIVETPDANNPDRGDLKKTNRSMDRIASFGDQVAQSVRVHFRWWRGEWFLDTRRGVPYLQTILGQTAVNATLRAMIRREALAVAGVADVDQINLTRDALARRTTVDFKITTTEGDVIPITSIPLGRL